MTSQRPTYTLKLDLAFNPWSCDCQFIQSFKKALREYKEVFDRDHNIHCIKDNGKKATIRYRYCKPPVKEDIKTWSLYQILNIILIILMIILIIITGYDYYQFRSCGRIPCLIKILCYQTYHDSVFDKGNDPQEKRPSCQGLRYVIRRRPGRNNSNQLQIDDWIMSENDWWILWIYTYMY